MSVFSEIKQTCSECGKNYSTKGSLKNHLWYVHSIGEGEYHNCSVSDCQFSCKSKGNLKSHLWQFHSIGEGEYHNCSVSDCPYSCKSKSNLKSHLWQVHSIGEGEYNNCSVSDCPFSCKSKSSLKRHLWQVHNIGEGEYHNCSVSDCQYSCKSKGRLKSHLSNLHDIGDKKCSYCLKNVNKLNSHNDLNIGKVNICKKCFNKATGYTSRKEEQMVLHIKKDPLINPYLILFNSVIKGDSCDTRRRPDCLISSGDTHMIVECDEDQHRYRNATCESGRMDEIMDELKWGNFIFIRWNPDMYKNENGSNGKVTRQDRLKMLTDYILKDKGNNLSFVTIVYMFYSRDNPIIHQRQDWGKIFIE
jgi:hypothetical protein